jgi:polar amino acid transport system substrate-binding protein
MLRIRHSCLGRALIIGAAALTLLLDAGGEPAMAEPRTDLVPDAWQGDAVRPRPDLRNLEILRFVTDSDFPPFHYLDEEGALVGFNVDLAQAICDELNVQCEIRAMAWDDLLKALENNEADAAIASLRITPDALARAEFTERYYHTPARFIADKDYELQDVLPETVEGAKVGVIRETAHEAYLRTYFSKAEIVSYDTAEEAQAALKDRKIDLLFGDGISLMFWMNSVTADGCCEFRGGPFLDPKYFGEGIGIAVRKGDRELTEILNYALEQVHANRHYEELFLRYFPMSFF